MGTCPHRGLCRDSLSFEKIVISSSHITHFGVSMKTTFTLSRKKTLAVVGASAALLVTLSACMSPTIEVTKPSSQASSAQTSSSAAERASDENTASTKPATDKAAAAPGNLTAPGTAMKFGEVAVAQTNTGAQGSEKYREATYDMAVTKIVAGTEADLSEFKDAAKFAGQTPYYVFTDYKLTALSAPTAGISQPRVTGHLKDGTEAQKLIVFGTMDQCKSTNFKTEGKDDAFTLLVGSSMTSCTVFLAPAGDAVTTTSMDGSGFITADYKDNKFRKNPLTWGK